MAGSDGSNRHLAVVIAEAGWSHAQVAAAFTRVASESGIPELTGVGRSHVSHWVAGSKPSGRSPLILCEALSRRLGRVVTPAEIGLAGEPSPAQVLGWDADTLAAMFSTAGELACLWGWMAFDNAEHALAQRYFTVALKLTAEAGDAPLAGHIMRAMAHQAVDLGHPRQALGMAAASMDGEHYARACPRERALFGVVHARALAASGDRHAATRALLRAEDDLAAATPGDEEPGRVFFFAEASPAAATACALRDIGDLTGSIRELQRRVRTPQTPPFPRTH